MKISAVIITYNEEKKIGRCLQSLKEVADEIVVVDSFSTDKTEEICEQYGVKFIRQKFLGYVEQKNFAMQQATFDYVLSLDADEALSKELKEQILKIKKAENPADAYKFRRLTFLGDKPVRHGEWYPDYRIRLWNRKKGKWHGINPHDYVVMQKNSVIKKIKADILHYSFDSISQYIDQQKKFVTISAQAMHELGKKSSLLKLFYKPAYRFFKGYFLKLGFLDGHYGLLIAKSTAFFTFLKYYLLYLKNRKIL